MMTNVEGAAVLVPKDQTSRLAQFIIKCHGGRNDGAPGEKHVERVADTMELSVHGVNSVRSIRDDCEYSEGA